LGIEYIALLLGALISYSRPFKYREGSALGRKIENAADGNASWCAPQAAIM
jgi:hypothetical protein